MRVVFSVLLADGLAQPKQMESQLEFIRKLAEDDNDGHMAGKVLDVLWILGHNQGTPENIMDVSAQCSVLCLYVMHRPLSLQSSRF